MDLSHLVRGPLLRGRATLAPLMSQIHPAPPAVLIAGADEWAAKALESILVAEGYEVLRAGTGAVALEIVRRRQVAALIVELTLPDQRGIELCRVLRADPAFGSRIPIVVLIPGPVERTTRLQAHMAGAWQVCGQPLDVPLLVRQMEVYMDVGARYAPGAAADTPYESADTRPPAASRPSWTIGAGQLHAHGECAAVAIRAGVVGSHPDAGLAPCAGVPDAEVLAVLGVRLATWCRACDLVGRLGEDEFGVLAPATGADGARRLVERLSAAMESAAWPISPRQRIVLRAGISAVSEREAVLVSAGQLLEEASAALREGLLATDRAVSVFPR